MKVPYVYAKRGTVRCSDICVHMGGDDGGPRTCSFLSDDYWTLPGSVCVPFYLRAARMQGEALTRVREWAAQHDDSRLGHWLTIGVDRAIDGKA